MVQKTRDRSAAWREYLALDGIVARLRNVQVSRDALTWTRFSGALALVLTVLLFVSGTIMTLYYSPAPSIAYDSVAYTQFDVPFGDLIRGVHYYAWHLLLVVVGLHLGRVFVVGAYKAPGQMVWISGVLMMLIVPIFIITGDLLPWDQRGYWQTQVRLSIVSSIPLVGDILARLVQGSPRIGIVTLTRFYVFHILFLPCMFVFLLSAHFHFMVHRPLPEDGSTRSTRPLWPDMVNRWLMLFLVVAVALGLAAWQRPAPLGDPADPSDASYVPKPDWWVLWLNQLVTIFKGPLMVCATVLIPGGLMGLLVALPFLDRSSERHPTCRKITMLTAAVIAVALLGLSILGYFKHYMSA